MRYIYTLTDPITNTVRYIGQTNNLNRRLNGHIQTSLNMNSKKSNTHKSCWIRKLLNQNTKPIINIIHECIDYEESNFYEKYYITKYTNEGFNLTNSYHSDVTEFSKETREKISKFKTGKKLEEIVGKERANELKAQSSERMMGNNYNKVDDPLVREKISNTLKEYFEDKTNHWAYGKTLNDERTERLRLAQLNRKPADKNNPNKKVRTEEQKQVLRDRRAKERETQIKPPCKRPKIEQYDLEMNLIRIWQGLIDICRNNSTFSRLQIARCCKGSKNKHAGYIWKYHISDNKTSDNLSI